MRGSHVALALALVLGACAPKPPLAPPPEHLALASVDFAVLPGWRADDQSAALPALQKSCGRLLKQADDRPVGPSSGASTIGGTVADWRAACDAVVQAGTLDAAAARALIEQWFEPFEASGRDGPVGLFTGYYEPELRGSLTRDAAYTVPLYKRPDDLVTVDLGDFRADWHGERIVGRVVSGQLKPYPDRLAIERGALANRGLELLWVDNAIDAFFVEIQGSARVALPDGKTLRIGYAAQNGHEYVAIGRALLARGALERGQVSMQTIRDWLTQHPDEAGAVMDLNPSYVFFKQIAGDGPVGAQGLVLTAGRSLAVDPKFMPLGTPLWLDIDEPAAPGGRLQRLVVAQDTGGAIRGPVRGDLFCGTGAAAAEQAGVMQQRGGYYLLLPRPLAERMKRVS
ncbi:MAG TPA: murein transglycosylase A [Candidatus Sulfotelmatobacter sp.]|nr:murein transglycosylase A [Candidatus Sulfotelmatobacter sp.]